MSERGADVFSADALNSHGLVQYNKRGNFREALTPIRIVKAFPLSLKISRQPSIIGRTQSHPRMTMLITEDF